MREQNNQQRDSQEITKLSASQTLKQRMDKKRAIRKNKLNAGIQNKQNTQALKPQNPQCKAGKDKISREERAKIQKLKNREAAQKSRETHRKYVENLEQEIEKLKSNAKQSYCKRCKKLIEDTDHSSLQDATDSLEIEKGQEFLEKQENYFLDEEKHLENSEELLEGSDRDRNDFLNSILGEQQSNSFTRLPTTASARHFGVFMLVVTLIAVFSGGYNRTVTKDMGFGLSEDINKETMFPERSLSQVQERGVIEKYPIAVFRQGECIKQLLNGINPRIQVSNLRGMSQYHRISGPLSSENSVLFCEMPKIYRHDRKQQSYFSRLVDIVVNGAEMMEIVGDLHSYSLSKMVGFTQLYRLRAEIKSIEEVHSHNCLL